jgi:hypothetical protein
MAEDSSLNLSVSSTGMEPRYHVACMLRPLAPSRGHSGNFRAKSGIIDVTYKALK